MSPPRVPSLPECQKISITRVGCRRMSVLRPSAPPPGRAHSVASLVRPRSATFVELYYIFISLWGHQLYTPYGILYVSFIILLVVTACVTVSVTYLQLSMENHHWWWQAVRSGGSTSLFIFAYCFYFLWTESHMYGFMQISFYFGYMLIICYAVFLMLGSVGWQCAFLFVKHIYGSCKCD